MAAPLESDDLPPPPRKRSNPSFDAIPKDYEVEGEIGRGGMGIVLRARHRKLDRSVALKLILNGAFANQKDRDQFLAEAKATARLQHPNIVSIFDTGDERGTPFIVLELIDGPSLAQMLSVSPLPPAEAASIVERLSRAVEYAHSRGVVHRDIKPANILMSSDGPKLVDFGVAKIVDASTLHQTGGFAGTPSYMAPEQVTGGIVGPHTDVYALGAVLYESLTGRPPFKAASMVETIRNVVEKSAVSPAELQPGISSDLSTICLKCLEKDPNRRYRSAAALAEDLRCFLDGRPISAKPVGRRERIWRWIQRNPGDAALIGGIFAVLFIGLAGVLWQWRVADHQRGIAQSLLTVVDDEQKVAKAALKYAEARRTELQRAVDNTAFLIDVIDLDQLFNLRALKVDRELLLPALAANRAFLKEFGSDPEREPEVVSALYRVAILMRMTDSREAALEAGIKALERQEAFVAANPDATQYKRDLAASYHNVGFLYHTTKRSKLALEYLNKARKIREAFVEAQPDNLNYLSELAGCWNDIGLARFLLAEASKDPSLYSATESALVTARDQQSSVVRRAPHMARYRQLLNNHLFNLGRLHAIVGKSQAAAEDAEQLLSLNYGDPESAVRAARIFALAGTQGGKSNETYIRRGVQLLSTAMDDESNYPLIETGFGDLEYLASQPEYKSIRKRILRSKIQPGEMRAIADRQ